jgi:lipid-A-disaccharide synthase
VQILISAGEASGEMYGAELIEALRHRVAIPVHVGTEPSPASTLEFFGAGGERMRAAGCEIIVDAKDLAVVGITEIVSHLPKILGLYKKLIRAADERKPGVAIVIDSPAFNWRVARQMRKRGIPVVYYVCPQFWAWRQGRVKLLRKYINKALVIFPFEEKFYRDRGVDAKFVGHPLANLPAPPITREDYAKQHGIDPTKTWITLMPGSRRKEVRMNLPTILEAAACLGSGYEFLLPVARTLEAGFIRRLMARELRKFPARQSLHPSPRKADVRASDETQQAPSMRKDSADRDIHLVPEALPALQHSRVGIIASGTATVEAAIMGTPFVMVYRVSRLTYALGRPRVKLPHFAMVNLIAGEEVVPELVQREFTADNVVRELNRIIPDGPAREHVRGKLAVVVEALRLATNDHSAPAELAAAEILKLAGGKAAG